MKRMRELSELIKAALEGIKRHPHSFLYDRDVQRAFRQIRVFQDGMDADVLIVSVPITSLNDVEKLKLLPIPVEISEDRIEFPWFPMEHDIGTVAMEFVDVLIHALDKLPENRTPTSNEIERIKEKYSPGTKIRIKHMADDYGPEDGVVDIIDSVDDIGQIHLRDTSLALISGVDEFEIIYVCSRCGKEFSYPPALSRVDNSSPVCRICGAEEAMIAAGASEEQMSAVLDEIRRHEE